ncbi:MAG: DNA primase DnaG [Candidatus Thermoplasmatota archaeon]|jgi:DNA primase|nr:DNA primase DnaG [Candidatus Thermoplasmatota archaeon]
MIRAKIYADGVVDKPDVVGAVFGQTEGLLGEEMDLRELQKSGRIGRIEVNIDSKKGKSEGEIQIPSSLDQIETAILASSLETVDRVGPCHAKIDVVSVEDIRVEKRTKIVDRAKRLLQLMQEGGKETGMDLAEELRKTIQVEEVTTFGKERLPAGPNIEHADNLIVVEGRNDVVNLLKAGIKNVIAVEGASVPQTVKDLSRGKTITVFTDGDRGGELILREMLQTMDVDFVARAPRGTEVEELTAKQITKCLRNKLAIQQYLEISGFEATGATRPPSEDSERAPPQVAQSRPPQEAPRVARVASPPPPPPPPPEPPQLPPRLAKLFGMLKDLDNPSRARILGEGDAVEAEVAAKDVVEGLLAFPKPASALVIDGVVSQRLLDVAHEKGIKDVVAVRLGAIGKVPEGIHVYTRSDIEVAP